MFMDRKELAKGGAKMAIDYLTGEKVDVKDYSQYDNGVKIVGTFTCGAQMIDKDNYQTVSYTHLIPLKLLLTQKEGTL